ncbi:MAG: flagellar basal body-associated protein FliL [Fimbriimonadaceae bacterium]
MSDAPAAEGGKKKGGKMPMIIGLVVVIAAGGYFGLAKGKSGDKEKPKKEAPKLGGVTELGEFTVNVKSGATFMRAKVAVHFDPTIDAGHADAYIPPLQDVVIDVLSDQNADEVLTLEGKQILRRRLAYEFNHRMHLLHPHEGEEEEEKEEKEEKEGEEKSEKGDKHADDHGGGHGKGHAPWLEEAEWPEFDSDKGPVLKVYITDLALQRQ